MARFNRASTGTKTTNLAGGEAYKESDKLELVSLLLTSFTNNKFYESGDSQIARLKNLIANLKDKTFVAKAALYARNEFGMRSITHVAAGEIAHAVKGEKWTRAFFKNVIHRPDDLLEILSYYGNTYGKPFPNSLKKGLADALVTFDEYKLAKYRGEGKDMRMVDAVNLLHPKTTPAIDKLMKGTLKSTDTWETKLTQAGQKAESDEQKSELKAQAWQELLSEKKLGYLALIRNLRNIIEQAPEAIPLAVAELQNQEKIKKSLVMPFQLLRADAEIANVNNPLARDVRIALTKAADLALENVPEMPGTTLIALDCSGSMDSALGSTKIFDVAALFTAALYKKNRAEVILFSDSAQYVMPNPANALSGVMSELQAKRNNGGTNFHSIFQEANKAYDRIIILSDMQGWMGYNAPTGTFNQYKDRTGANPNIFSIDLAGHGSLQFPEEQIYCLAGFSDKIFDTMKMLERDKKALLHEIEAISL